MSDLRSEAHVSRSERPFGAFELYSNGVILSIVFPCKRLRWGLVWGLCLAAACGGGMPAVKPGTMPEGGDFTGVWHSPQYGEMHMVQEGPSVRGKYEKDQRSGTIRGQVEGDLLRFEWIERRALIANRPNETRGHGYFRYQIDPDNGDHILRGRWGLDDDDQGAGPWNAYKLRNREPELEGTAGGEAEPADEIEELGDDLF